LICSSTGALDNQGSTVNAFLEVSHINLGEECSLLPCLAEMTAIFFFGNELARSVNHVFKPTAVCKFYASKIFDPTIFFHFLQTLAEVLLENLTFFRDFSEVVNVRFPNLLCAT
jgi:hypothetical protein